MEKNVDSKVEGKIKTWLPVMGVLVTVTVYVHTTFATNNRVDKLETRVSSQAEDIADQKKISCLTALEVGVSKDKLPRICSLDK